MNILWKASNKLYKIGGVKPIARIVELISFIVNSNAISARASIGKGTVFYHHGCGCVVHENTIIGQNCNIFQNVTLGSKWTGGVCDGSAPMVGDNVFIGAGAVIIGPIRIGNNAIIGANAVVLVDVPSNATVLGVPGRIVKIGTNYKEC